MPREQGGRYPVEIAGLSAPQAVRSAGEPAAPCDDNQEPDRRRTKPGHHCRHQQVAAERMSFVDKRLQLQRDIEIRDMVAVPHDVT